MDSSKKKKTIIFCVASLAFVISCVLIWVFAYSQNGAGHFFPMNVLLGKSGLPEESSLILSKGETAKFSFVSFDSFGDLSLYVNASDRVSVEVTLLDSGWEQIAEKEISIEKDTERFVNIFSGLDTVERREVYILRVKNKEGGSILLASRNGGTAITATGGIPFVLILYVLTSALIYLILFAFFFAMWVKGYPLNKVFVFVAIPFVILFSIILYPGTACDENDHYVAAYQLSNRLMGLPEDIFREEDTGILSARWLVPNIDGVYLAISQAGHRTNNLTNVSCEYAGHVGNDVVYLLPAVGITIGRILEVNAFTLYYFGRIMNILLYLIVGYISLSIVQYGKGIMLVFLLFPLTINQCISVNQDCFCFSISFLAVSHWAYLKEKIQERKEKLEFVDMAVIAVMLALLLLSKAYIVIAGIYVCLLDLSQVTKLLKNKKCILVIIIGAILLAGGLLIIGEKGYVKYLVSALFGEKDNHWYNLRYYLDNPAMGVNIFFNTLKEQSIEWFKDAFGSRLSWETYFSPFYATIYCMILLLLALTSGSTKLHSSSWEKVMVSGIEVFFFLLVYLRASTWTQIGRRTIWGMQGRYFVPVLPLIFYACIRAKRIRGNAERLLLTVFVIVIAVQCVDLVNNHILTFLVE